MLNLTIMTNPDIRKYGIRIWVFLFKNLNLRWSCAITDLENGQVIITGGDVSNTDRTVSVYSEDGHHENLADMNQGRRKHGCTSYASNNGTKLSYIFMFPLFMFPL